MNCNAELHIADDYGDNHATMHCQLPEGHDGLHREEFQHNGAPVTVEWMADERESDEHERYD
jgi:hypothetical protein